MVSPLACSYYKNQFLSINVAKKRGVVNIAKPVMLLAIFDGISNGEILSNHIVFNDILVSSYKKLYSQFRDGYITPAE